MFAIFKRKKITEDQLALHFINSMFSVTETCFGDVCQIINNDTEFASAPNLDPADSDQFLMIVISGNLKLMGRHFEGVADARLAEKIYRKLALAFGIDAQQAKEQISKYQSWMDRINHPSKNTHYAMSKAVFHKYNLNRFQTDYFRNMNAPNPIFLKRLDEVIAQFIFDWEGLLESHKISEG